jgi:hypothetical protein
LMVVPALNGVYLVGAHAAYWAPFVLVGRAWQRGSWAKEVVSLMVHGDRHPAKRELADDV